MGGEEYWRNMSGGGVLEEHDWGGKSIGGT